jgi:bifunctional UDP-N-acetylglucosamine pyrophosphorylase / glucosamine-1-phosphate N-acetyltransferase
MKHAKHEALIAAGVRIVDPATTYIDAGVSVGPGTVIHPNVYLEGRTTVGASCEIHASVRIVDSVIADRVVVNNFCVILGSRIAAGARVGPFAHLRPESDVREDARVGNFVELKKTVLGAGSKANHLTYLGDATVGARVNVGAGTITCNYDGERKHPTIIEDEVFIGSDSQLIAPVRVGRGAYVAAGSSITEDVPPDALAIARGRQVNKAGWVAKRRKRL